MISDSGAFRPCLAGADFGGALDVLRIAFRQMQSRRNHPFQAIILQLDLIADLSPAVVSVERQVRQRGTAVAVEHLQVAVGVRNDLAQERVEPAHNR